MLSPDEIKEKLTQMNQDLTKLSGRVTEIVEASQASLTALMDNFNETAGSLTTQIEELQDEIED